MTIRHLECFIKVCELNSISKAAEELNVAQPSVSQTIKELESYYHIVLFIRANKKLTLTKEGEELLVKARELLESFKDFEDTAKNIVSDPKVRIGASLTFGRRALPLLIKLLKEKIPNIDYYLYIDKTITLEEKLIKGELDFALAEGLPTNKMLESKVFAFDYLYCIAGNNYNIPDKIKLADFVKYDVFAREINSNPRKHLDYALALKGIKLNPKMVSISNSAITKMVENNLGIALLPRGLCEPLIEAGLVRKIELDTEFKRPLHIIYHKDKKLTEIQKKAMKLSVEFLRDFRQDD